MFSSTTIALSTTMPTANERPASEITLSVRPSASSTRKVPMTETGIAMAMMLVETIERRKTMSTTPAIAPPMSMFCVTSEIEESM